ncbi:MAG TPA: gluconate 2-dehydrogenase subunit 3 family protein [Sphingobacteriaceae bacterium]
MDRREALKSVALLLGGTVIGAEMFLQAGCKPATKNVSDLFKSDNVAFMNEIAETILPETSTPGAKAAKVGDFMAVMVRDCYKPEDQEVFIEGLSKVNDESDKMYKKNFMELDAKQRTAVLTALDVEQRKYAEEKEEGQPNHYFRMMKELTLLGFFTSEVGATKALRYLPVPGRYDGCMPYKKGDKAWAT